MQDAADAALYNLVDHVLKVQPSPAGPERRQSHRHSFDCIQLVAPYDGRRLPSQAEFCKVRCQDLSRSGFSYYCRDLPKTKFVIIALGNLPFRFYVAEIVHCKPLTPCGDERYLVGCRLLQRMEDGMA